VCTVNQVRYIVIGAGAVGGGIGGCLHRAGLDAVLVARGDQLTALRRGGLEVVTPAETYRVPVVAVGGPDEVQLTRDDILVLATKTQQAEAALLQWVDAPVIGGGTAGERLPMITALNGVASEWLALRYFARVYGACVWMWANFTRPGRVILSGSPTVGLFHLGRVPAAATDDTDRELLDRIVADWHRASLEVRVPADVMPWKYRKLLTNLGNAYQALLGDTRGVETLIRQAVEEGRAVLDQAGIEVIPDEVEAEARTAYAVVDLSEREGFLGGSTWQSLVRGTGNVEIDYLNGEIVLEARRHGREAPVNARIAALVRQAARRGDGAGSLTVGEIRRALDG
jgi:2-dehydropantoate 2-reductase